ncbi:MAG: putative hydrolase of the superfamily [Verrucomicrobiales bacterium]|nr:putative hydrolase of the superfamily [Verrucomicrobiales bacterium]
MKRLIDHFSVLLFDMGKTFVFNNDRFDASADLYETYRSIGGQKLSQIEVETHIRACFDGMLQLYTNPVYFDNFPSLTEGFQLYSKAPESERSHLEEVFAIHEFGTVSPEMESLLKRLASSHQIGLISNIWSPKKLCLHEFKRAGIGGLFSPEIFSSDFRSIKPSRVLFNEALRGLAVPPNEVLFIGDSLAYDMEGARNVGIKTLWITAKPHLANKSVDYQCESISELEFAF